MQGQMQSGINWEVSNARPSTLHKMLLNDMFVQNITTQLQYIC